jgi:hypothetical protein
MLLHSGETLRRSAYAVLEGDAPESARGPGILYLTTQRLVFEAADRRIGRGRAPVTLMDAALAQVRNVAVRRSRIGHDRLLVELTMGRPVFDVLDPPAWTTAIAAAKRAGPPASGGAALAPTVIERQVVKVRCRYCGSLANEVDGRCPRCGASL